MKIKALLCLFLVAAFYIPASRAELLPGEYQLLEVLSAPNDQDPYSWDVTVVKKDDGRLFLKLPKEKFDASIESVEVEIRKAKKSILFELHFRSSDSVWIRVYSGTESEKNVFSGSFQDLPETNPGRFRLVPKKGNGG
jgi:hypothetical protein